MTEDKKYETPSRIGAFIRDSHSLSIRTRLSWCSRATGSSRRISPNALTSITGFILLVFAVQK